MFTSDSNQDEGTKTWLKQQLMSHEQYQIAGSKNKKTISRNDVPINQRRLSNQLRGTLDGRLHLPYIKKNNK